MKNVLSFIASACFLVYSVVGAEESLTTDELHFFETKIRPVLVRECYGCHSSKAGNVRGGLRLDTKERMLLGGATGPSVVPGDLEESWLYNAIT
ncbi:MAG: c-type cytochrome domain-containing protein, partial [Pirellulales bacterium]